jgi:hypothetical protein
MTIKQIGRYVSAALLIGLLSGCRYPLPAGFVRVDPPYDMELRAVSADGAAITLRRNDNPENGDLAFWEKAIMARLVDYRGYKLAERRDILYGDKLPGVELNFDYQRDGIDYVYSISILVKGSAVYCIEVAGEKKQIAAQLPAIRNTIHKWPLP